MPRTFGFDNAGAVIEAEAEILREARLRLLGKGRLAESQAAVAKDLADRGVKGARGGPMSRPTLRRALANPRIAGLASGDGGELVEAVGPAIFTRKEFEELLAYFEAVERPGQPDPASHIGVQERLLGRGGLLCGGRFKRPDGKDGEQCRHVMPGTSLRGVPCYACRKQSGGCGRLRVNAEHLEKYVAAKVLARVALPEVREALVRLLQKTPEAMIAVEAEMSEVRSRRKAAARDFAAGDLSGSLLREVDRATKAELKVLQARLDALERFSSLPFDSVKDLATWWVDASVPRRRAVVQSVANSVMILPTTALGGKFREERVVIDWKPLSALV